MKEGPKGGCELLAKRSTRSQIEEKVSSQLSCSHQESKH